MTPLRQSGEDLRVRAITLVAVVSTVVSVVAVLIAVALTPADARQHVRRAFDPRAVIAGVEQQPFGAPARSARLQAAARARLEAYARTDAGVARIPIERALELVVEGRRPAEAGASAFTAPPSPEAR